MIDKGFSLEATLDSLFWMQRRVGVRWLKTRRRTDRAAVVYLSADASHFVPVLLSETGFKRDFTSERVAWKRHGAEWVSSSVDIKKAIY